MTLQWIFVLRWIRTVLCALVSLLVIAIGFGEPEGAFAADPPAAKQGARKSAATLVLKPKKHNFGRSIIGLASPAKTVNVTNNSKAPPITFSSTVAQPPL